MDYSSSSSGAVVVAFSGGAFKKESTVPSDFLQNSNIGVFDSKSRLAAIAKTFPFQQPQLQEGTLIGFQRPNRNHSNSNGGDNYSSDMSSNISDILRSNKRTSMSMMMNAASPLDVFANNSNNGSAAAVVAALSGFPRQLSSLNNHHPANTTTTAMMANAAAALLHRPLKRSKVEGDERDDDGGVQNGTGIPKSVTIVQSQQLQHQQQQYHHPSDDSNEDGGGDDDGASHGSLDPNGNHQGGVDGASGVRFREYQAEIWSEKFEELCLFRRENGHCHVPHHYQDNQGLAQWVKRQRYQYKLKLEGKRSTLSDERVRLLNTIGFIWNSHDAVFAERLQDLTLFKSMHGHCMVPSNYEPNVQLAIWTKRQRRQYKKFQEGGASSMTPERIAQLETIGFVWDCRKLNNTTKKNEQQEKSKNTSPVLTASAGKATNNCNDPFASSVASTAVLAQQQQQLLMLQNHQPNESFTTTSNHSEQPRELPSEEQQHDISATTVSAAKQQQQPLNLEQNEQTLPKMPKCEFFSFSHKFHY